MGNAYIYNGFGQYEDRDGQKGIAIRYAGLDWWLPYQKVTAIPNWTLREVDHDRSTPPGGEKGELVYQNVIIQGGRIAEELCDKQMPVAYKDMGILTIQGKPTGRNIIVNAGCMAEGVPITTEIPEREATASEIADAEIKCKRYKERIVADYFQSKRERMSGGKGRLHPDATTRRFMDELGMEDLDDVTAHAKNSGMNPEVLRMILTEVAKAVTEQNADTMLKAVQSVRSRGKRQLAPERIRNGEVAEPELEVERPEPSEAELARRRVQSEKMKARHAAAKAAKEQEKLQPVK